MRDDKARDRMPSKLQEIQSVGERINEQPCDDCGQLDQEGNQLDKSIVIEEIFQEVEEEEKVMDEQYDIAKLGMDQVGLEVVNQSFNESCSWHQVSSRGELDTGEPK